MRLILAIAMAAAPFPLAAQQVSAPVVAKTPDYTSDALWLCRPGRSDACTIDQSATVIAADGTRIVEPFVPASDPKFDCFYLYPTVSLDPTPNSDLIAGTEEKLTAASQAGRFARHCRVFAPLYRQVTLAALRDLLTGKPSTADRALALADVKAAWADYLARDNGGRGVVLIGHSQGALVLKALIADDIDGKPVAARMISAMLIGTNIAVPVGKDVGGDFKSTPLCRKEGQTGCIVTYVSFRADAPPPPNSRFGAVPGAGMAAGCTNPAALAGGSALSDNYFGARSAGLNSAPMGPWTKDGAPVATHFVKVPGLISTACAERNGFNYLAVTVNADPADPRTDTIVGDIVIGGQIVKDWGLHLIDMPVVMGNLVDLSNRQAQAWAARTAARPTRPTMSGHLRRRGQMGAAMGGGN